MRIKLNIDFILNKKMVTSAVLIFVLSHIFLYLLNMAYVSFMTFADRSILEHDICNVIPIVIGNVAAVASGIFLGRFMVRKNTRQENCGIMGVVFFIIAIFILFYFLDQNRICFLMNQLAWGEPLPDFDDDFIWTDRMYLKNSLLEIIWAPRITIQAIVMYLSAFSAVMLKRRF